MPFRGKRRNWPTRWQIPLGPPAVRNAAKSLKRSPSPTWLLRQPATLEEGFSYAVVVISAVYWGWTSWQDRVLEKKTSVTKRRPEWTIIADAVVKVRTKCSGSLLSYVVTIEPRSTSEATTGSRSKSDSKFSTPEGLFRNLQVITIRLEDKDGFLLQEHELEVSDFMRVSSESSDEVKALERSGTLSCTPAIYDRADHLRVGWRER